MPTLSKNDKFLAQKFVADGYLQLVESPWPSQDFTEHTIILDGNNYFISDEVFQYLQRLFYSYLSEEIEGDEFHGGVTEEAELNMKARLKYHTNKEKLSWYQDEIKEQVFELESLVGKITHLNNPDTVKEKWMEYVLQGGKPLLQQVVKQINSPTDNLKNSCFDRFFKSDSLNRIYKVEGILTKIQYLKNQIENTKLQGDCAPLENTQSDIEIPDFEKLFLKKETYAKFNDFLREMGVIDQQGIKIIGSESEFKGLIRLLYKRLSYAGYIDCFDGVTIPDHIISLMMNKHFPFLKNKFKDGSYWRSKKPSGTVERKYRAHIDFSFPPKPNKIHSFKVRN